MLKKIDVNDATLANIFLETKALQKFLADPVFAEERDFYALASDVIDEVYGKPVKSDFANISTICWFYTPKQNVLWKLLQDRGIIPKKKTKTHALFHSSMITRRGQNFTCPDRQRPAASSASDVVCE